MIEMTHQDKIRQTFFQSNTNILVNWHQCDFWNTRANSIPVLGGTQTEVLVICWLVLRRLVSLLEDWKKEQKQFRQRGGGLRSCASLKGWFLSNVTISEEANPQKTRVCWAVWTKEEEKKLGSGVIWTYSLPISWLLLWPLTSFGKSESEVEKIFCKTLTTQDCRLSRLSRSRVRISRPPLDSERLLQEENENRGRI